MKSWASEINRQLDDLFTHHIAISLSGSQIKICILPGNLLCDNKAMAILHSVFGSGSDYREPWRPWALLSRSDRVFWQGDIHTSVREIMAAAGRFMRYVEETTDNYVAWCNDPNSFKERKHGVVRSVPYRIRMVVSKQPSKPLSKRKTRDTLTEAERQAIIGQGIMVHGHKYKKNPWIHHPDSGNAINDSWTSAPDAYLQR